MIYRTYLKTLLCSRIFIRFLFLFFSFLLLCLTGCVSKPLVNHGATPSPNVIYTAYPSYVIGEIMNVDGCIRIRSLDNNKSSAIIWTPDTSASIDGDEVRIITGIVRKDISEVVFHFGDIVKIGGGESAFPDKELLKQLPPNCDGPYWIIGSSITSFQLTEEP